MSYQRRRDVDSGWAWMVLLSAFITRIILGGLIWSITAYFVVFRQEFGESRSFTALVGSVTVATLHGFGPLASYLMQRFGTRLTNILGCILLACNFIVNSFANGVTFLILSHSIFFGVGLCLINNSSLVALTHYFDRYLYMATGISLAGSGIGIFIFAFLVPYVMDLYGWRGALFILAGCALQVCICGAVIYQKQVPSNALQATKSVPNKATTKHIVQQLCNSGTYWCMNFSFLFLIANFTIVTVLYKDFAVSHGLESHFSYALAAFGVGDITGRVIAGLLASHKSVNVCLQMLLTNLLTGLVITSNLAVHEVFGLTICGFLLGALVGAQVALLCMIPAAVWGRDFFLVAIGYVQTTAGFGAFLGPPVAGFLADLTKSYTWSFIFAALMDVIAATLVLAIFILDRKEKRKLIKYKVEYDDIQSNDQIEPLKENEKSCTVVKLSSEDGFINNSNINI